MDPIVSAAGVTGHVSMPEERGGRPNSQSKLRKPLAVRVVNCAQVTWADYRLHVIALEGRPR
jgi:hypothetical protein